LDCDLVAHSLGRWARPSGSKELTRIHSEGKGTLSECFVEMGKTEQRGKKTVSAVRAFEFLSVLREPSAISAVKRFETSYLQSSRRRLAEDVRKAVPAS
jgi:hypothetical protein